MRLRSLRSESCTNSGHPALRITWSVSGSPQVPVVIGNCWQWSGGSVPPLHYSCVEPMLLSDAQTAAPPSTTPQGCFCSLACFYSEPTGETSSSKHVANAWLDESQLERNAHVSSSNMFYWIILYVQSEIMHRQFLFHNYVSDWIVFLDEMRGVYCNYYILLEIIIITYYIITILIIIIIHISPYIYTHLHAYTCFVLNYF